MRNQPIVAPELLSAYLRTEYMITHADVPIVLRIGHDSPALTALLAQHELTSAAFITACNPRSKKLSAADNAARQAELRTALDAGGWTILPGEGRDPRGEWEPEASFVVLGIEQERATALAEQFEQNAYLWLVADDAPRLMVLKQSRGGAPA